MNDATKQTILYLRERASFYGLRAKERHGTQAFRDRAISRAYREDARSLESDKVDDEAPE
ncbi:hypothetical protein LJR016_004299 [Devosia sp. LjRoot16]|uniref:hypothetical protein n=1 Tax=Devosia sp. LjRoot16 TaxID=3342271 RepID=UPI003ECE63CE